MVRCKKFSIFHAICRCGFLRASDKWMDIAGSDFCLSAFLLVLLKHLYFTHCVRSAFEGFKSAFADPSKLEANALHAMLTYEKALSRYSNLLNSKVYEQLKQRLSSEWEVLKQRYSIV